MLANGGSRIGPPARTSGWTARGPRPVPLEGAAGPGAGRERLLPGDDRGDVFEGRVVALDRVRALDRPREREAAQRADPPPRSGDLPAERLTEAEDLVEDLALARIEVRGLGEHVAKIETIARCVNY